jgi:serine/threonine-protein kinase
LIGQNLGGKYRVVRLIGEGGMGAVYEGEQLLGSAKRKVAVKTLHAHLSHDANLEARFEREVATIAELEHPNTIQVYDFGSTPQGVLYIVMEFLHGASLSQRLVAEGAMAPDRATHVLEQVCGSLEEAHGRGIVHRDLKPDNVVLVERAGQKDFVKVLDFGIAKRAREPDGKEQKLTEQGMVLGTPPYMSPEQFTARPIDARSDIYSLGVLAYETLTGKLPFKADTAWEWAAQHMTQPPTPIESLAEGGRVPSFMRSAIARALAKSPDDRFQTVREFIDVFAGRRTGLASEAAAEAPPRARTELSSPLDVAAAFRPSAVMVTPTSGNMSLSTPAPVPALAPPAEQSAKGSGGRATLLAAAGVVGVASVVAIAFAVHGGVSLGNAPVVLRDDRPLTAPATSIAPAALMPDTVRSADDGAYIPPLSRGGATPQPRATGRPTPIPSSVPHAEPGASASVATASTTLTAPSATQPPPAAVLATPALRTPALPSGRYDGPECQKARVLKGFGRHREAQSWTLACLAKGGIP